MTIYLIIYAKKRVGSFKSVVSSIKSTDTLDLDCKSEFDDAEQKNGSDEMANMAEEKDAYQGNGFETINENDYYKMNSN